MPWVQLVIAGGSAALKYSADQKAAAAQKKGLDKATQLENQSIAQQNALTGQQLELTRPLIQTRDSALNVLQRLFGLQETAPTKIASSPGFAGTSGAQLIPLPGITTDGTHSKQTNEGLSGSILPGLAGAAAPDAATLLGAGGSKPGAKGAATYFDPSTRMIVDAYGNAIAKVPESGVIPGVLSGFNNPVEVRGNQLFGIGSHGSGALNIALPDAPAATPTASGTSATATGSDLASTILNNSGLRFAYDEGNRQLQRSLAARGLLGSGSGVKDLTDYAGTQFGSLVLNPLFQLAGFGNTGTSSTLDTLKAASNNNASSTNALQQLALTQGNNRASSFGANASTGSDLLNNFGFLYKTGQIPGLGGSTTPVNPNAAGQSGFDMLLANMGSQTPSVYAPN